MYQPEANPSEYHSGLNGSASAMPGTGCALVGPRGAGKTVLALTMSRSCCAPDPNGPNLCVRPQVDPDLMRTAASFQFDGYHSEPSADSVTTLDLEVDFCAAPGHDILGKWKRRVAAWLGRSDQERANTLVQVVDGPGGAMFPPIEERERVYDCGPKLQAWIESSRALIVCINAAQPELRTLYTELPIFLARITGGGSYLPFRSVLVLLTQVDRLATGFLDAVRRKRAGGNLDESPLATPLGLCELLEPLALARSIVGDGILHEVWKRVEPGRKFGVGVASAVGFDRASGSPPNGAGFSRGWRPFGVDEALYFCLNREPARDRNIGPVREFVKGSRIQLPESPCMEIPLEVYL